MFQKEKFYHKALKLKKKCKNIKFLEFLTFGIISLSSMVSDFSSTSFMLIISDFKRYGLNFYSYISF